MRPVLSDGGTETSGGIVAKKSARFLWYAVGLRLDASRLRWQLHQSQLQFQLQSVLIARHSVRTLKRLPRLAESTCAPKKRCKLGSVVMGVSSVVLAVLVFIVENCVHVYTSKCLYSRRV